MGKLANIARNVVGVGGEYISLNDLIANYPEGVTVSGVSIRDTGKGKVTCFTFAEDPNKYAYAVSGDLKIIFESWLEDAGGIEELNDELQYECIKLKIQKVRTKKGNTYTKAWVVSVTDKDKIEVEEDSAEVVDGETGEILTDIAPF